jgi:hypothetical protein
MNNLFAFAFDAASADMVSAYIKLNEKNFSKIKAFFGSIVAKNIYLQHIPEYICEEENIYFSNNSTIVTGTSGINSSYEMGFLKKAKQSNIKQSIVIVDNISNFEMRFLLNNDIIEEEFLADEIWIFNSEFKSHIDYLNKRLVYKENIYEIYLNKLFKKQKLPSTNYFIQRNKFNYLVILSEYLYELYGLYYGFTEYEMLENILDTIDKSHLNIPIFIKLHPRENQNKYNIILRKFNHLNIVCENCNIYELIFYSKIVFGINSSVFLECNLFNKPTFSVQIGSKKEMCVKLLEKDKKIFSKKELENILINFYNC